MEVENELQHRLAFGRYTDVISDECLEEIRMIKNNQPTDSNVFLLNVEDADEFTDQAWKLLGRYIANNTHLVKIDLDGCHLTDEKMTLFFSELVRSSSLKSLLLGDNEFGIAGVQSMVLFLRNAPNLSNINFFSNNNISKDGFELVISALDGKSVEELYFYNCNITDISALDTYNLPNLQRLDLDGNNIGKEGCITLSNLIQKEGSNLKWLYLNNTGIDDEGTEILAAALKHNTKLISLDLEENDNITERGYKALLKVLIDVSSIESTYNSNNTLSSCNISDNTGTRKLKYLISSACTENKRSSNPAGIGKAKVIKYHLNSQTLKELCQLQGIESSAGSIFADIEPALLPKVLWLIGSSHGQSELYTALVHTAPGLLSYIDRKAKLNDLLTGNTAKAYNITAQITALTQQLACLTAQKADIHKRLELVELGDTKQLGNKEDEKERVRTKRQRS